MSRLSEHIESCINQSKQPASHAFPFSDSDPLNHTDSSCSDPASDMITEQDSRKQTSKLRARVLRMRVSLSGGSASRLLRCATLFPLASPSHASPLYLIVHNGFRTRHQTFWLTRISLSFALYAWRNFYRFGHCPPHNYTRRASSWQHAADCVRRYGTGGCPKTLARFVVEHAP